MYGKVLGAPWDHNARTGRILIKSFDGTGITPIWNKPMWAISKQAWRGRCYLIAQSNILVDFRRSNAREWWAGVMLNPPHKRDRGSTERRKRRPVRLWGNAIVEASDGQWRHVLDGCKTMAQWNCKPKECIENLVNKWKLQKSQTPSPERVRFPVDEKVKTMDLAIVYKERTLADGFGLIYC